MQAAIMCTPCGEQCLDNFARERVRCETAREAYRVMCVAYVEDVVCIARGVVIQRDIADCAATRALNRPQWPSSSPAISLPGHQGAPQ